MRKDPYAPQGNKLTSKVILALLVGLLLLSLSSCSALEYVGNPAPNMKTVHMATMHDGYTIEDYNQHPDHDCDQNDSPYVLISDRH